MRIIRAGHMGMCFGVRDAIQLAKSQPGPLTILGDLVHNQTVLADLERQGVTIVHRVADIRTPTVMITAHGASDRRQNEVRESGLNVVEATCPLVHFAHNSLRKLANKGAHPVVIGKRDHVEVRGLTEDFDELDVVLTAEDVERLEERPCFGVVAQTTQPIERVRQLVEMIRRRFQNSEVRFIDTVCQPTKQRQISAVELAQQSDVLIVIGGANSNNTHELVNTCRRYCDRVHHVQTAGDLRAEWFHESVTVGLTAGTSTPDAVIDGIENWLLALDREFRSATEIIMNKGRSMIAHLLATLPETVPDDPFYHPRKPLWLPQEMKEPPPLKQPKPGATVRRRFALLINPFYPKSPHGSFGKHVLTPTLALTSVAGATPTNWEVRYWDENLLQGPPPMDPVPEVAGISVHLTFARRAYALAAWYRHHGAKIVLGGLHAQSNPEEVAPHADALAIGDGVQLWPQILRDVEQGKLKPRYEADYTTSYRKDPLPRRELLSRDCYLTTTSLIATRGCHNRCGFCYLSTKGLQTPYRVRDVEDIRRQFECDDQPYAVFIDNNLGSKPDYLRSLCRALAPLEKIWSAAVTLDVTDDPGLVRERALSGCTGVFIGFETLSDGNLAHARKRTPRTDDYARRVRIFHENGIQVNGSFVLGFDEDRKDSFARLADWIEENRMECATFHILTPYPGTPLFRQMEAEGRLLHRDWDKYDTAHVVFRPKHMTPEELMLGYDWMYRRLFSHQSIWKRRPVELGALPAYLAGCYLYKRSNRLWHFLIKRRLVRKVWRPLVELTRQRHVRFRRRLVQNSAEQPEANAARLSPRHVVSAGV